MKVYDLIVVGGGAAGFFGAINAAMQDPSLRIAILERTQQVLSKVRISGGGRCNVTHACFEPQNLVKNYPRGGRELIGPFTRFQPTHTIDWFKEQGVILKVEQDGRMFPVTDSSETIISCFLRLTRQLKIDLLLGSRIESVAKENDLFKINLENGSMTARNLLLASGSSPKGYELVKAFGHSIIAPVPSLFTFNVPSSPLLDLAGIAVSDVEVTLPGSHLKQKGPLLLTHWGFSGPAILKLSAFGARFLHEADYKAKLLINWLPNWKTEELIEYFSTAQKKEPSRKLSVEDLGSMPKNFTKRLFSLIDLPPEIRFGELSKKRIQQLVALLQTYEATIEGKTTYKQEFVTCGGIALNEVNFKKMESKKVSGLFFAGEILDIDGVTGGFNFQSAWTTSWLSAQAIAEQIL